MMTDDERGQLKGRREVAEGRVFFLIVLLREVEIFIEF